MMIQKFEGFDPQTAKLSVKFLVAGPDKTYDTATLIVFSSVLNQHTDVHARLTALLETEMPQLLTAGVFTRQDQTKPYKAVIGSNSLDKANVAYAHNVPDNIRDEVNRLINEAAHVQS